MSEKDSKNTAPMAEGISALAADDPLEIAERALETAGEALVTAQEAAAGAEWANVNAQSAMDQSEAAQEQAGEAKTDAQQALEEALEARDLAREAKDFLDEAVGAYITRFDPVNANILFQEAAKLYLINDAGSGLPMALPAYLTVAPSDSATSAFQVAWNADKAMYRTGEVTRTVIEGAVSIDVSMQPAGGGAVFGMLVVGATSSAMTAHLDTGSLNIDASFPTVLRGALRFPLQGADEGVLKIQGRDVAAFKNGMATLAASSQDDMAEWVNLAYTAVRIEGDEIVLDLRITWTHTDAPQVAWQDWTAWGLSSLCPGIFVTLCDQVDADDLCDASSRYLVVNEDSVNFPVDTPLYCKTVVDDRAASATQYVWNLDESGVYMRTWARRGSGQVFEFSEWKTFAQS